METVIFDFDRISTFEDFYKLAATALQLPDYFGNNLDALWDCITGDIALPVAVQFRNLTLNQLEKFDKLIILFEDASAELGDNFRFEYYLKQEDGEE